MDISTNPRVTDLPGGRVLRVTDGQGHGVAVFEGVVWITQTGDDRDVFLRPGEHFHYDHDGIAVVEALSDARVTVYRAPSHPRVRRGAAATLLVAAVAIGAGMYTTFLGDSARAPAVVAALGIPR